MSTKTSSDSSAVGLAKIAVIGVGWWAQGWHLPHLSRNKATVKIVGIVEINPAPKSPLNPNLETVTALTRKYECLHFTSVNDLLKEITDLDGVIVCTPHSTHYEIGKELIEECVRRDQRDEKPLNVLMEKPMTTSVKEAKMMHDLVTKYQADRYGDDGAFKRKRGCFLINHSANYREQAKHAKDLVMSGKIGDIRHVTGFMASPLLSIFDDPANKGWNEPDTKVKDMIGNGFAWGQSCHLLGWIFHVCGCDNLVPEKVFCAMNHSNKTGADVSHSSTIVCSLGDVNMSISGTTLLPGDHGKDCGKRISIKIFGTLGTIIYIGDDMNQDSGCLEYHSSVMSYTNSQEAHRSSSTKEFLLQDHGFLFENTSQEGTGPESLQNFIQACRLQWDDNDCNQSYYVGADTLVGLRTVQTVDAMYRSSKSGHVEAVV